MFDYFGNKDIIVIGYKIRLGHGQVVKASDSDSETESSNLSGPARFWRSTQEAEGAGLES